MRRCHRRVALEGAGARPEAVIHLDTSLLLELLQEGADQWGQSRLKINRL
jgi:hypothetical protein